MFDGNTRQYIDAGSHTFNIRSNGGFTAIALVQFPSSLSNQRIFDFANGPGNYNIIMRRSTSTNYVFEFYDPGSICLVMINTPPKNSNWILVFGRYNEIDNTMEISVDGPHSDSPSSSDHILICSCNSGYIGNNGGSCAACGQGTYKTAQLECTSCVAGKEYDGTAGQSESVCQNCAVGKFAALAGTASCTKCEPGKYQYEEGKVSCHNCEVGKYQPLEQQESCSLCPAGKFRSTEMQGSQERAVLPKNGLVYSGKDLELSARACQAPLGTC